MLKEKQVRLQGNEWRDKRSELTPISYIKLKNGHVKGVYKTKADVLFYHWLGDNEIAELEQTIGNQFVEKGNCYILKVERNRALEGEI